MMSWFTCYLTSVTIIITIIMIISIITIIVISTSITIIAITIVVTVTITTIIIIIVTTDLLRWCPLDTALPVSTAGVLVAPLSSVYKYFPIFNTKSVFTFLSSVFS